MDDIYGVLGRRIREERQAAGWTLEQLGERAGITGAFVAHIEAGRKHGTLETVAKIARALDLQPADLLRVPLKSGAGKDALYLRQLARLIKDKTPRQKQALLEVLKSAAGLAGK